MTKMKGLLLGAAAGLASVASAQAADLPVKAAPVEYVKVCSLYGAGFFYIPGTDTCLKIGGYLRIQSEYNMGGGGGAAGNGFSASIDLEDGPGGRGKLIFNASNPGVFNGGGAAGLGGFPVVAVTGFGSNDALRSDMPDIAANLRVDQAWGSAQIMGALANRSAGYYSNFPGLVGPAVTGFAAASGLPVALVNTPGGTVFGHPGEVWGYAVGVGAKFVNFLLPRDTIEGQASFCHGAVTGYCVSGLYAQQFIYGGGNSVTMAWTTDGIFTNGSQVELTNAFNWALGYQHYWSPQWRTAVVGGQAFVWYNGTAAGMFCGAAVGSPGVFATNGLFIATPGTFLNCNPNFSQSAVSTRTAWNPHPFLEIGLDLIYFHVASANGGSQIVLGANGARPRATYTVGNFDGAMAVLRFQKNILP